jgi:uncharacterized coiled-coil protein SlyX
MTEPNLESRMMTIESHLAELEHLVDRLNEVIQEQNHQLRHFSKAQNQLTQKIQIFELDQIQKNNEKPPHYQ